MSGVRVLQAMAGARHGGAEAFFVRLVGALARAGVEQRAAIRRHRERAAALRVAGVAVRELGFRGRLDLATTLALAAEIRRFRPGVVLTWMNRATDAVPPRALCGGARFVHAARLGGYYDLRHYRRCDHLVANTRDIARYAIAGGWAPERVHYLPNFVDEAPAIAVDRASLDTPPGVPLALALGRLHENKAFDVLIAALARLPDLHLWLAGAGELRDALEGQVERLGLARRVRFLGWRADAAALMEAADLVVVPSRREPLGNVVLEAWARRRPVVAAASEGPAALIGESGRGLLVPVDDPAALAAALARVVGEPGLARSLAQAGRVAYETEFTERAVVARYVEFFEQVAR